MTFTLTQLFQLFLAICGAIITVGGAWAVILKIKTPEKVREEMLKKHSEMLDNDNKRLKELEESNKILMQSMLALMAHELDGNHADQLRKAKNDLEEYLIRR